MTKDPINETSNEQLDLNGMVPYDMFRAIPRGSSLRHKTLLYLEIYFGTNKILNGGRHDNKVRGMIENQNGSLSVLTFLPILKQDANTVETGVLLHKSSFSDPMNQTHEYFFLATEDCRLLELHEGYDSRVKQEDLDTFTNIAQAFIEIDIENITNLEPIGKLL